MTERIIVGDCLEVMPTFDADRFDSIVCDPPYHLTTGKKGGTGPASDNPNSPAGRSRIGTGFMGKKWDGGDVAFRPETWAAALRVAKPGAHLVAFGGTRTFHRLMCAIEDGGWEIRDTLMWVYGSGFPKSHNGEWGGTALKPAWEPIILARKPLAGTVAANVQKHGTGALNIDGCRIGTQRPSMESVSSGAPREFLRAEGRASVGMVDGGRWPANLVHDGSDEVVAPFPQSDGQLADIDPTAPSAKTSNVYGAMARNGEPSAHKRYADDGATNFAALPGARRGDSGSAARFFYCAKASSSDRNDGCETLPQKVGGMVSNTSGQHMTRRDGGAPGPRGNHHPTVKPTELMRWLCRLVTPPGGTILDHFCGSGSTGKAALLEGFNFIGIDLEEEHAAIARARIYAAAPLFASAA